MIFILTGMALVTAYGISFGNRKTYQWLTAITVNFFWQIFVESVIKVKEKNQSRSKNILILDWSHNPNHCPNQA